MAVTVLFVLAAAIWALAHVPADGPSTRRRRRHAAPPWRLRRRPSRTPTVELTTELASRIRSGVSPTEAWQEAAARAGLDPELEDGIPRALADLPDVRAAWVLAGHLGAPLADILDECAAAFMHAEENASARAIALAGPSASARLLAVLPVVGMVLGGFLGADPLAHLLGGGVGTAAGLAGGFLYAIGLRWSRRLLAEAARAGEDGTAVDPTVTLALVRAGLRGGISVPRALAAAGHASGTDGMVRAGRLLLLGASWPEAWAGMRSGSVEELLARIAEPAWTGGADPVPLLERAAAAWNARRDRRAREAAARLGVRLIVPLGTCYLPAFVLVGVLPVLFATGGDVVFAG